MRDPAHLEGCGHDLDTNPAEPMEIVSPPLARQPGPSARAGSAFEVFRIALGLGLTAFGGPVAHIGYFERTYVRRLHWLTEEDFARLAALCQMLPGPASSQLGFLIGLGRAGWTGAAAAWAGFTLPSAALMFAFALAAPHLGGPLPAAALHGLNLVAVAVVAQAVRSMGARLCPDLGRVAVAAAAAAGLLVFGGPAGPVIALAAGAFAGLILKPALREPATVAPTLRTGSGFAAVLFAVFLAGLAAAFAPHAPRGLGGFCAIAYRSGALVFGGGHVVLPLLRDALVPAGWLSDRAFLSGYGAAQALPGPLFAFAAYLGAVSAPTGAGLAGAAAWAGAGLAAIFLPGLLLAAAGARIWTFAGEHPRARDALAGVNAAVVGVLGAALYSPVWTTAVRGGADAAVALVGYVLLDRFRAPPILVACACALGAVALAAATPLGR